MGKRKSWENELKFRNPLPILISSEVYGPLPDVYPHNPISWIYFAYKYVTIQMRPVPQSQAKLPKVEYVDGMFRVVEEDDMHYLFDLGFFGKGNLSRSEPTWKERETKRLEGSGNHEMSSEEVTRLRREERKKFKTERARLQELELLHRQGSLSTEDLKLLEDLREGVASMRTPGQNLASNFPEEPSTSKLEPPDDGLNGLDGLESLNREYLQLQATEVFFLKFALNSVSLDLSLQQLFTVCCHNDLGPRNKFILDYVCYHHYRSLGWCVRSGVKFGCDFLLYKRGPPFSHAEHAILVVPEHPLWLAMSTISRVIGGVKKNLVLVFILLPLQQQFDDTMAELNSCEEGGKIEVLSKLFKLYQVNEIIYRRWIPNKNRD